MGTVFTFTPASGVDPRSDRIPGHIVQPGPEVVIEVDPEGALDPSLGVRRRIPEAGRLRPDVRTVPPLELTLTPFVRTGDPGLPIVEIVREMAADPGRRLWSIQTLLPVDDPVVTAHEPVRSSTNSGFELRNETGMIRVVERGRGYCMGLLPEPPTGLLGVALFGGRSGWAVAGPRTMAHELYPSTPTAYCRCGPPFLHGGRHIGVTGRRHRNTHHARLSLRYRAAPIRWRRACPDSGPARAHRLSRGAPLPTSLLSTRLGALVD